MRYDFVFEDEKVLAKDIRMPFVHRLLRERKAAPFKLSARPPTVTMPRIKVTGS